ncbi:MAG: sigma-70 family RNA polymerase sigma factor [Muribaculaceae bacterium]|nr:sigma-70 family RNA polymerase sigma factor [Muribaculaceae bacterium]
MCNNEKDFERLVRQQTSTVYSVCYMFAEDKVEADDLFQEILINLWRGFEKFRYESRPSTWVYRVSLNTCISYKRKRKISTSPLECAGIESAYDEIERSPQSKLLHQRIRLLEPFDRAIVLLWLEDMSYEEIGAIVGLSVKAVGVRLMRIREKLKKLQ